MSLIDFSKPHRIPPSLKMIDYMLILFNACGFTENSRNVWLSNQYGRSIKHLDDLGFQEAHEVIGRLKEIRGDKS